MCMALVREIVESGSYPAGFGLNDTAKRLIEESWKREDLGLYGRFDFAFDGEMIKLLEYNADTPTSLLEAAVAQWHVLEDRRWPDQFNSLHEKLVERWKMVAAKIVGVPPRVHFAGTKDAGPEDWGTIHYLMDTALSAGLEAKSFELESLGWNADNRVFVDLEDEEIHGLFKLYAWEWMMTDKDAPNYGPSSTRFIEPPWKMLLSNKALLPELWKRHPNHPLLLPSYYESESSEPRSGKWARKPILSREGANVSIVENGASMLAPGSNFNPEYDAAGYVLQAYATLPTFDGFYPVIGSWVVGDEPAGMGIRDDPNPVTGNNSHFVPHYFE